MQAELAYDLAHYHRGRHAHRLVNLAEVVIGAVQAVLAHKGLLSFCFHVYTLFFGSPENRSREKALVFQDFLN